MTPTPSPKPLFVNGQYLVEVAGELIVIAPSAKKKRGRSRWWRAMSQDVPLTEWLATPRIVLHVLRKGSAHP